MPVQATLHYEYVAKIRAGLESHFHSEANVFTAANLFWYAVEGWPSIRCAPSVMVVFDRPKGHRDSYKQWAEGGIAPQVVFEILPQGMTDGEFRERSDFFEEYGVEEYIIYDPYARTVEVRQRDDGRLIGIGLARTETWHSPRLGISLQWESDGELSLFHCDGQKFLTAAEIDLLAQQEHSRAERLAAKLRELGIDPETLS
jgi:Uma2 family endonuclease